MTGETHGADSSPHDPPQPTRLAAVNHMGALMVKVPLPEPEPPAPWPCERVESDRPEASEHYRCLETRVVRIPETLSELGEAPAWQACSHHARSAVQRAMLVLRAMERSHPLSDIDRQKIDEFCDRLDTTTDDDLPDLILEVTIFWGHHQPALTGSPFAHSKWR